MATFERNAIALANEQFDVLIIGGGISGAWLALHCQQAGLKTALIERGDFASETSAASSKLLHGGIRYLQQLQFTKVRESTMERAEYIYAAPHLSTAIPFIVPTYPNFGRSKFFLNCGMLAYACLGLGQNRLIDNPRERIPGARNLSQSDLNQIYPLDDLNTGGVVFYERHMFDSERMVLEILKTAARAGARICNYVNARTLLLNQQQISGVTAEDLITGNEFAVRATRVINAAGPWIDRLNEQLPNAQAAPSIKGFAVGSHIITRQISDHAIAITTNMASDTTLDRGGRHVFVIPWRGYSLIGTSYAEIESCDGPILLQTAHVDELLNAVNRGLPSAQLRRADLISGYSGLYPLHTHNIRATVYQGSGEYQIIDHAAANGVDGLITALGAKFTTGRKLSAITLKLLSKKLGKALTVKRTKLDASQYTDFASLAAALHTEFGERYATATLTHLAHHYGSDARAVLALADSDARLRESIMPTQPDLLVQVAWAALHEQAITLQDVLFGRLSIGLLGINEAQLASVAQTMGEILHWTDAQQAAQIATVTKRLRATEAALRPRAS